MPKSENKTLVTFLLDRTGSMQSIKQDTIGAFNAYIEGLKADKKVKIDFTLIQFDSISLDKTCVAVPVSKAPELNEENYQPRASTPLIDAAYKTIKAVEKSIVDNKKTKVVVCIQTDGEENASTEYSWDQLNALIKEKSQLGWQFNFMGASIDAYKQASKMGISTAATMSYDSHDKVATRAAFSANASNTVAFASGKSISTDYDFLQKSKAGDKFDPAANAAAPLGNVRVVSTNTAKKKAVVDDFQL